MQLRSSGVSVEAGILESKRPHRELMGSQCPKRHLPGLLSQLGRLKALENMTSAADPLVLARVS